MSHKYIEKFEGTFEKEKLGVTIIPTEALQGINNPEALGVYVYLLSQPDQWELNVKQLCKHFNYGRDKMYRTLNHLLDHGWLTCVHSREQGKFAKPHYIVHLHQQPQNSLKNPSRLDTEGVSPRPEKPDTVKPDTVNQDTYKSYKEENIEVKKEKHMVDSDESTVCQHDNSENSMPAQDKSQNPNNQPNGKEPTDMQIMKSNNPYNIDEQLMKDMLKIRRQKRLPMTVTAWNMILEELEKCVSRGMSATECFKKVVGKTWASFEIEWLLKDENKTDSGDINGMDSFIK